MTSFARALVAYVLLKIVVPPPVMASDVVTVTGGAVPNPVLKSCSAQYDKETGKQLNYQGMGTAFALKGPNPSGVIVADRPLSPAELTSGGWQQIPLMVSAIVPIVRIPGVRDNSLVLDAATLRKIMTGDIPNWGHKDVYRLNPKVIDRDLDLPTTRVVRADGAAATYGMLAYLQQFADDDEKKSLKPNSKVEWGGRSPAVEFTGDRKILDEVQTLNGAIGYVDYSFARSVSKPAARVKLLNAEGHAVEASMPSLKSAVQSMDWGQGPSGKPSDEQPRWPLTMTSYILVQKNPSNKQAQARALDFFQYFYEHCSDVAEAGGVVAVPKNVGLSFLEKLGSAPAGAKGNKVQ